MNIFNSIILLICINIIISIILCIITVYSFNFIKKAIDIFDKVIAKIFKYAYKFDKAFFDENKFKDGDMAFVGIITKVDDNDKNETKDKIDKK